MKKIKGLLNLISNIGLLKTIKSVLDRLISFIIPITHKIRWFFISNNKNYCGVTNEKRKEEIIVSITSYPARISFVIIPIQSFLMQSTKPNKLILWLAEEQFQEKKLPEDLLSLQKYGLTIKWCNDIKSYKKLIPALKEYPDSIIITADDDLYFRKKTIEKLYSAYLSNPNFIHCHRITKFYLEDNTYKVLPNGYYTYPFPTHLHKLSSGAGVLFPPKSLYKDVTNSSLFTKLTPTNDDIWFWCMAILNNRKCNIIKNGYNYLTFVKGSQINTLSDINDRNENLFWKDFNNIIEYYPKIDTILKEEYNKLSNFN